jgi:hypothetical protein
MHEAHYRHKDENHTATSTIQRLATIPPPLRLARPPDRVEVGAEDTWLTLKRGRPRVMRGKNKWICAYIRLATGLVYRSQKPRITGRILAVCPETVGKTTRRRPSQKTKEHNKKSSLA